MKYYKMNLCMCENDSKGFSATYKPYSSKVMDVIVKIHPFKDIGREINTDTKLNIMHKNKVVLADRDIIYLDEASRKVATKNEVKEYIESFNYDKFNELIAFEEKSIKKAEQKKQIIEKLETDMQKKIINKKKS